MNDLPESRASSLPRGGVVLLSVVLLAVGGYLLRHRAYAGPEAEKPSASAPRHLAPHDTFYLLEYVSAKTPTGVVGFEPGQTVRLVEVHRDTRTLVVGDGQAQVEVDPEKLTNDMDLAAMVRQKDQANQAAIAQYVQAEQKAYNDAQKSVAVEAAKDIEKSNEKAREASALNSNDSKLNRPPVEVAGGAGYGYSGNAYYGSPYSYFSGSAASGGTGAAVNPATVGH